MKKSGDKCDQDDLGGDADAARDPGQHQGVPGRDHRVGVQDLLGNPPPQVAAQTKVSPLSIDIGRKKHIFCPSKQSHFPDG